MVQSEAWSVKGHGLASGLCDETYLLLPRHSPASCSTGLFGLQLQDGAEQLLRGDGEEADLSVGVQAVQVGALRWQHLFDIGMVALRPTAHARLDKIRQINQHTFLGHTEEKSPINSKHSWCVCGF